MTSINNQESSLFSSYNSNNKGASQEDIIESRLSKRQQDFINSEDFSQIKESTMSSELSIGNNSRNLLFKQRRLKQNIIIPEITYNLKDKLSIPLDWFEKCNTTIFSINDIFQIISAFKDNSDIKQKFFGLVGLRKILLLPEAPIQEILNMEIIPELIKLFDLDSNPEFQYESLLCLSYLIAKNNGNEQISSLIIKQGIKKILKLFDSPIEEIKLQVPLLIGNLISNSYKIRELLIEEKIYDKLITILSSTRNKILIKNCTYAITHFFRIKPIMNYDTAKKSIKLFAKNLILLKDDYDFLSDACFILGLITENYKEGIKELMEFDIMDMIIKLLDCTIVYVQLTSLRIIGNIAAGNANQTQKLIDLGLLSQLKKTIFNQKKIIRKESAWILSNIAAGTQKQIEILISEDFLPIFKKSIFFDEPEVKKECIWAVCNLTSTKNNIYLQKILEQGILECMQKCLMIDETKIVAVTLEALGNLLIFGKNNKQNGENPVVKEIERLGMYDLLEGLQRHPVEIVYEKTLKLLLNFFEVQYND